MARRTRRLWTDEEKRSICLQTTAPGVSVAQVALRYTVNANLIFKWLRDTKYRPAPRTGAEDSGLRFLPVEIIAEAKGPMAMPAALNHIEIELAQGVRVIKSSRIEHKAPVPTKEAKANTPPDAPTRRDGRPVRGRGLPP